MATRIDLSATGRADLRRIIAGRLRLPSDRRTLIWQIVTAPWWLWSDIPRLPLPVRDPDLPSGGLAGDWVVRGLDRIRTRLWTQWALVIGARSLVLALLIGCIWLLGELLGGPALDTRIWMLASSAVMLASVTIIVLSRPTRARTAYMLDRSFDLQERVSTALGNIGREIPTETGQASVIYLQVADAANAMTLAQEHPALRVRPPARELVLAVALALACAAFALARGAGGGVPATQTNLVPEFVPAAQRFVQPAAPAPPPAAQDALSVSDVEQMTQTSLDNQHDLQLLADALADHAVTRDAADAIRQGDYSQAAQDLRALSQQADQLSESTRSELASDLRDAAAQMSNGNDALSHATQQAADGLESGGDAAKTGVRDLANAVEQSGQQVRSSAELDQALEQARQNASSESGSSSSQQTASQGQPSESQPDSGAAPQPASSASGPPSGQPGDTQSQAGSGSEGGTGSDPAAASDQSGAGMPTDSTDPGAPGQQPGEGPGQPQDEGSSSSGDSSQPSKGDKIGETDGSGQGGGAGESAAESTSQGVAGSASGSSAQNDAPGKDPSAPQVSDVQPVSDSDPGVSQDPRAAVELSRAPQGESVRIGGSSGGSSLGTGAGVTVSSGSAQQGEVGPNGPDSNHVPPEYRFIVERYFSDREHGG